MNVKSARIAFQGERGAFSEEATRQLLGQRAAVLPCMSFEDLFRSLKEGRETSLSYKRFLTTSIRSLAGSFKKKVPLQYSRFLELLKPQASSRSSIIEFLAEVFPATIKKEVAND